MMQKRSLKQQFGFTIVEIIVVLGIIAIIIGLGLINFQVTNDSSTTFSASRDLLLSDLRLTAEKALNGERFQGQEPIGWGIQFVGGYNTYTMFADLDGDRAYDTNEKFRYVKLNSDLKVYPSYGGVMTGSVVFNTGNGKTYFNNSELAVTPTAHLLINLLNKKDALVNTLQVTPAGTVSVANKAVINPSQPNTVPGLVAWYKADALALSNGNAVGSWTDSSGFGNHATQNGGARPTFITNAINSFPVVRFDGSNDNLAFTTTISNLQTVFVVMKWIDPTPDYSHILGKTGSNTPFYGDTDSSGRIIHQSLSYSQVIDGEVYNNGTSIPSSELHRDKANFQIITMIPYTLMVINNLGTSNNIYTHADYAEIIIYNTVLDTDDRQAIESYLSSKYNISVSY